MLRVRSTALLIDHARKRPNRCHVIWQPWQSLRKAVDATSDRIQSVEVGLNLMRVIPRPMLLSKHLSGESGTVKMVPMMLHTVGRLKLFNKRHGMKFISFLKSLSAILNDKIYIGLSLLNKDTTRSPITVDGQFDHLTIDDFGAGKNRR